MVFIYFLQNGIGVGSGIKIFNHIVFWKQIQHSSNELNNYLKKKWFGIVEYN